MTTQNERILRHLRDHGSITSLEAFAEYGITRLSARIFDLRHDGHKILSFVETAKNRYGEPVRYYRYMLDEERKRA